MTFDQLADLLKKDRTYRRFRQCASVSADTLAKLVGLTRFCASGRNLQPLKYRLVTDPRECQMVFSTLAWAGYFPDWDGPEDGERPSAYLVQCLDTSICSNPLCDDGLQLQAITLGATALGLGCCIIKSFRAKELSSALDLPDHLSPRYVVAIGEPAENVVIEDMDPSRQDSHKYYRDSSGTHHVPKRPLTDLIAD